MRHSEVGFASLNQATEKQPRFVVGIIYDTDSIYITSHDDITSVPGSQIPGALLEPNIVSQRLKPDEAAAEIGSASFSLVDLGAAFTDEVRERLADGDGLRGRRVQFFLGYAGMTFADFELIGTQDISGISYAEGRYNVSCLDIQRALRTDILKPVQTTLAASISDTDAAITLSSVVGLQMLAHGASYSDAPNATVGYIKIKNEVIRYSAIVGSQLTGCVRGIFGTTPGAYVVDPAVAADRREKVSEYVYLEEPAIKLAYAILTGAGLPIGWHLGIDPALIALADFEAIGTDLWNPADDEAGLVLRFEGLKAQDGKRFLEKEIYLLAGVFSPVYSDGRLGLRRMVRLGADAATVATLDESNSVQVDELTHDFKSLHNIFVVNWSWNGTEFRRATGYADATSLAVHGEAPLMTLNFKGLFGGRHTDGVIFQSLDMLRDRYAGPPLRLSVELLHGMNMLEVGDVVRVRYAHVRDFSQPGASIDRAFEIQNVSINNLSGRVSLELFASTAEADVNAPTGAEVSLPDVFYSSQGTALSSVPGMVISANVITAAPAVLSGHENLNNAASIYYHDADLTLGAGVTLNIAANVQLRIRGFFTINGTIDGVGRGLVGVADDGRMLPAIARDGNVSAESIPGNPGYVGSSRGYDGVLSQFGLTFGPVGLYIFATYPVAVTPGRVLGGVAPRLFLVVDGTVLNGLPSDLRGTGGGPGGRVGESDTLPDVAERGGTGANGGAGLLIISRGLALGASGIINLSGADSVPTIAYTPSVDRFPGAGGAGGPGACYILLDGGNLSIPDLGGNKFRAHAGTVPVQGSPLPLRVHNGYNSTALTGDPIAGFEDPDFVTNNAQDLSGAALVVQHIPAPELAAADVDSGPPPPTGMSATGVSFAIDIAMALPSFELFDTAEIYASLTNDRASAARVFRGRADAYRHRLPDASTRYYWARTRIGSRVSAWFPIGATAGVGATAIDIEEGASLNVQYSADGVTAWHDPPFVTGDQFMRQNIGGGAWSAAIRIVGEVGAAGSTGSAGAAGSTGGTGNFLDFVFKRAATVPATPTGSTPAGWYDSPPSSDGNPLWISSAEKTAANALVSTWTTPTIFSRDGFWIARGQCVADVSAFQKVGGTAAWDSDVYSHVSYGKCYLQFKASQINASLMIGINATPDLNSGYIGLDFAWFPADDGSANIYESGVSIGAFGTYTTDTVFGMIYDGATVKYYKDRVLMRSVAFSGATFFDSSFATPGGAVNSVEFGPGGELPVTSTGDIAPGAATGSVSTTGGYGSAGHAYAGTTDSTVTVSVLAYINDTAAAVILQSEFVMTDVSVSWDNSVPSYSRVWYEYSSASSGSGTVEVVAVLPDGNVGRATPSFVQQIVLNAGDTLTLSAKTRIIHPYAALISWASSTLRHTAIKR